MLARAGQQVPHLLGGPRLGGVHQGAEPAAWGSPPSGDELASWFAAAEGGEGTQLALLDHHLYHFFIAILTESGRWVE